MSCILQSLQAYQNPGGESVTRDRARCPFSGTHGIQMPCSLLVCKVGSCSGWKLMTWRQFAWVGIPAPNVTVSLLACLVTQSCLTLWDPLDCILPGSSVHVIFFFSRQEYWSQSPFSSSTGSSQPRDWTGVSCVSCIAGKFFTNWAIREVHNCESLSKLLNLYSLLSWVSNENNSHIYLLEWFWGFSSVQSLSCVWLFEG